MTIHPEASVDECMQEIGALEAEVEQLEFRIKVEQDKTKIWDEEAARLRTEVEQLRAESARRWGLIDASIQTEFQCKAEIERLKADFLEYGNHKPDCRGGDGSSQCKCGYINIWAALEPKP